MSNFSSLIRVAMIFGFTLISLWGIKFLLNISRTKKSQGAEIVEKDDEAFPYIKKNIMTDTELKFYGRLISAFPSYLVFTQVQLSQVVKAPTGPNNLSWTNKINRMSLDFVLCDNTSNPICAIELDDKSHLRESAKTRDMKKDKALNAAGIPIVRIKVEDMPTVAQLPKVLNLEF